MAIVLKTRSLQQEKKKTTKKNKVNDLLQNERKRGACKSGANIFSNLLMTADDHFQPARKVLSANDLYTKKTTTQITEREVYS